MLLFSAQCPSGCIAGRERFQIRFGNNIYFGLALLWAGLYGGNSSLVDADRLPQPLGDGPRLKSICTGSDRHNVAGSNEPLVGLSPNFKLKAETAPAHMPNSGINSQPFRPFCR